MTNESDYAGTKQCCQELRRLDALLGNDWPAALLLSFGADFSVQLRDLALNACCKACSVDDISSRFMGSIQLCCCCTPQTI